MRLRSGMPYTISKLLPHALIALLVAPILAPAFASAMTFTVLHQFCRQKNASNYCNDGSNIIAGLVRDGAGNLFGEAYYGGSQDAGTVFELVNNAGAYTFKRVWSFCTYTFNGQCEGQNPLGGLIADVDGNVYGVTEGGGTGASGTAFELYPAKALSHRLNVMWFFCADTTFPDCPTGSIPLGLTYAGIETGALFNGTSPLYGITFDGGADNSDPDLYGAGTFFSLQWMQGKYTVLWNFSFSDGYNPRGLGPDAAGNFYGTTAHKVDGASPDGGTVFELSPSGSSYTHTDLYTFCSRFHCADGAGPVNGPLARDKFGRLVGVTVCGRGSCSNSGILYRVDGSTERRLHVFCSQTNCADGDAPGAEVIIDSHGNIFGTTSAGGAGANCTVGSGCGVVFEYSSAGVYSVLWNFCSRANCTDGRAPEAPLIVDASGDLYGTTNSGGLYGQGTVFRLTP
jgi:uncharacterized repeat protein (TIGR03803 family)